MDNSSNFCDLGNVKVSSDVIATIASTAAMEINGVVGFMSKIPTDFKGIFGIKNMAKGILVEITENEASIDMYLSLKYGSKIQEVSQKVQENVKNAVDTMTGMEVTKVNIFINGVVLEEKDQKSE